MISADGLPAALARLDTGETPPQVTLRADRTLEYGRVMGVMGELNRAGFNSISLVTSGAVPPAPVTGGSVSAP